MPYGRGAVQFTGVSPSSGTAGQVVAITGTDLSPTVSAKFVKLGQTPHPASSLTVDSDTLVHVTVPTLPVSGDWGITLSDGTNEVHAGTFSYS